MSTTPQSAETMAKLRPPGGMAELLAISLPMVVSQACDTLMMFTDRLFLARLGPEQMSAAMGGGLVAFLFMTFFMGLTGYGTALVAQYMGSGQEKRCARAAMQGVWIALLAWPVIIACKPIGPWMFSGIAPEQLAPQTEFFNIVIYGAGFGLLRNALGCFFSGIGRTRVVMAAAMVAMLVNMLVNWVLIFGHLGFPAMGIRGSAIGTLVGGFCGLLVLVVRYFAPCIRERYGVMEGFILDGELMRKLVRLGTPSGAEFFLNMLGFNLLVMTFHSYGVVEATAMTITFNWDLVSFIPLIGVGIGVTSLVGRYMGAGHPELAHRATLSGVKMAAAYVSLTFTAFCIFPEAMVDLFRPAHQTAVFADIHTLAVYMVRLMVVYLFADAMTIVFSSALRGAGDTLWTAIISVSAHWSLALTAILMVRWFEVGARAAWAIIVCLILLLALAFFLRYRSGAWRNIRVLDGPPQPAADKALAQETV